MTPTLHLPASFRVNRQQMDQGPLCARSCRTIRFANPANRNVPRHARYYGEDIAQDALVHRQRGDAVSFQRDVAGVGANNSTNVKTGLTGLSPRLDRHQSRRRIGDRNVIVGVLPVHLPRQRAARDNPVEHFDA
jgi:hypothetical protein